MATGVLPPNQEIDARVRATRTVSEASELPKTWERTANKGLAWYMPAQKIAYSV